MEIITVDEFKTFSEINNPKSDAKIASIVAMVNDLILLYCNISTEVSEVTERFTNSDNTFVLSEMPVSAVTSVKDSALGVLNLEDFYLIPGQGILEYIGSSTLNSKARAIEVTYTRGYTTIPNGLKQAAIELANHYYKREFFADKNLGNGMSLSAHDTANFPAQVRAALDLYRVL